VELRMALPYQQEKRCHLGQDQYGHLVNLMV
jgi:hypothetical protein